ncbi:16290_t:CDS:1, partial [Funneliformis mosseae]
PFKTTSFFKSSKSSSPEVIIEEIAVSKEKKDKFYKQKRPSRFKEYTN